MIPIPAINFAIELGANHGINIIEWIWLYCLDFTYGPRNLNSLCLSYVIFSFSLSPMDTTM